MNLRRVIKRIGLLSALGCWFAMVWILYSKTFGTSELGWSAALGIVLGLLAASTLILWAIFHIPTLPTLREVQQVVEEIRAARAQGIESYKSKLHFSFPPHWRTRQLGKEGWSLGPKGLGAPVSFTIWAVMREPEFADTSFEGMVRNAEDIAAHGGGRFDRGSVTNCQVAGVKGITYWQRALKGYETLGFFWCYEDDDYAFWVDAYSRTHIELIRPAIDEFIRHFRMG